MFRVSADILLLGDNIVQSPHWYVASKDALSFYLTPDQFAAIYTNVEISANYQPPDSAIAIALKVPHKFLGVTYRYGMVIMYPVSVVLNVFECRYIRKCMQQAEAGRLLRALMSEHIPQKEQMKLRWSAATLGQPIGPQIKNIIP